MEYNGDFSFIGGLEIFSVVFEFVYFCYKKKNYSGFDGVFVFCFF